VNAVLCTFDSSDVGFARYCTRTSTKRTPNIISLSVTPSDWVIAAGRIGEEKVDEREETLEIDYQIGEEIKKKVRSVAFLFLFVPISFSMPVYRSYRVLSTISLPKRLNLLCSRKHLT
jgi:hypothetical protein